MLDQIKQSCENFPEHNAFFINGKFYTYKHFAQIVSNIKNLLNTSYSSEKLIGFITNDDIESYSSVFGILFAGLGFVPVNPENPIDRNLAIIEQSGVKVILNSKDNSNLSNLFVKDDLIFINITNLPDSKIELFEPKINENEIAYILFTSGSTGIPKGVPLTRKNLSSFINAFFALGYEINEQDRFLQMFDMTFDLSLMSYIVPLCKGACVYTVPPGGIKYTYVYSLLEEQELTFALMVPSIISYLRPYFKEINLTKMKYSLFCGEALYEDIVHEWMECVPNALVQNVYGPTEATIFCSTYNLQRDQLKNKNFNGIVAIGKAMKDMGLIVITENGEETDQNQKGELCLYGDQLTPGYWKNQDKNRQAFFKKIVNGKEVILYRTGDLSLKDEEGDFLYCGRIDSQVKIQGFRVELSEIEHYAREFSQVSNIAAIVYKNKIGNSQIFLFVENFSGNTTEIEKHLKTKLPSYMIPSKIYNVASFPLNVNGKVDRKSLANQIEIGN